jgi:predicted secreted protein
MKFILGAAALVLALTCVRAQDPTPSPTGETEPPVASQAEEAATPLSSPAPASTDPIAEASPTPEPPPGDSGKMKEEVNLADTPTAEDFTIEPPADEPDADSAPEVTEPLEGDEDTTPRPAVTGTVEVTAKNQDQIVHAAVGNLIRITLESNPSTGYNWELRDFDYGVADFYRSDVVARQGKGNVLFGAPSDTVITIQAVKPGTQDITLVYRRQWEPPEQIEATFRFQLEVAGNAAATDAAPASTPAP